MQNVIALTDQNNLPIPEGKKGGWITAPQIAKKHKYYVLNVAELDFEEMKPQPKTGKPMFAEDGHLYCGADSVQSADKIFETMLKSLIVENAELKKAPAPKKILTSGPKGIIKPFPNGMIFRPVSKFHN